MFQGYFGTLLINEPLRATGGSFYLDATLLEAQSNVLLLDLQTSSQVRVQDLVGNRSNNPGALVECSGGNLDADIRIGSMRDKGGNAYGVAYTGGDGSMVVDIGKSVLPHSTTYASTRRGSRVEISGGIFEKTASSGTNPPELATISVDSTNTSRRGGVSINVNTVLVGGETNDQYSLRCYDNEVTGKIEKLSSGATRNPLLLFSSCTFTFKVANVDGVAPQGIPLLEFNNTRAESTFSFDRIKDTGTGDRLLYANSGNLVIIQGGSISTGSSDILCENQSVRFDVGAISGGSGGHLLECNEGSVQGTIGRIENLGPCIKLDGVSVDLYVDTVLGDLDDNNSTVLITPSDGTNYFGFRNIERLGDASRLGSHTVEVPFDASKQKLKLSGDTIYSRNTTALFADIRNDDNSIMTQVGLMTGTGENTVSYSIAYIELTNFVYHHGDVVNKSDNGYAVSIESNIIQSSKPIVMLTGNFYSRNSAALYADNAALGTGGGSTFYGNDPAIDGSLLVYNIGRVLYNGSNGTTFQAPSEAIDTSTTYSASDLEYMYPNY